MGMIAEEFPQLAALDAEQKLILAGELWKSAIEDHPDSPELSRNAVILLEERMAHFQSNPDSGIKWEDLRNATQVK